MKNLITQETGTEYKGDYGRAPGMKHAEMKENWTIKEQNLTEESKSGGCIARAGAGKDKSVKAPAGCKLGKAERSTTCCTRKTAKTWRGSCSSRVPWCEASDSEETGT